MPTFHDTTDPSTHPDRPTRTGRRLRRRMAGTVAGLAALGAVVAVLAVPAAGTGALAHEGHDHGGAVVGEAPADAAARHPAGHALTDAQRITAMVATARYQDVAVAEAAGWASTIDTLGCFQSADGGMGVHHVNAALMDATLDPAMPEALVYELGADGHVVGLVAHEYIVPVDAWTSSKPPVLFGMPLHRHPTLPLWVLHTWLWKPNPRGELADWNPAVRPCPDGVPIFGVDLPAPAPAT